MERWMGAGGMKCPRPMPVETDEANHRPDLATCHDRENNRGRFAKMSLALGGNDRMSPWTGRGIARPPRRGPQHRL